MKPQEGNRRTGKTKPIVWTRQARKVRPNKNLGIGIDDEETHGRHVHQTRFRSSTTHEKTDQRHVQRPSEKIESAKFQSPSGSWNESCNHCPYQHCEYAVGWS